MKLRFRRIWATVLATAILGCFAPAYAAHTTSSFTETTRNYLYTNTYDTALENGNLGFDRAMAYDPENPENKVMHITDANGTGDAQSSYNVISFSGLSSGWSNSPTYKSLGVSEDKLLIMETDIYLTSGMLNEIEDFQIGAPSLSSIWDQNLCGTMVVTMKDSNTFLFKTGTSTEDIEADKWYNIKYTYSFETRKWESFIDNIPFASGVLADWQKLKYEGAAMGIKVLSKSSPLTTGFYVDNSAIYQNVEQNITFGISDGETGVVPEEGIGVDLGVEISVDKLNGLFTAERGETSVVGAITANGNTGLTVSFINLEENAEYTLKFAGYSGIEAVLNPKSLNFTTKAAVDMTVTADIADGAEIEVQDNEINLVFSKNIVINDVLAAITFTDEDNNAVVFTGEQTGDNTVTIKMQGLTELTSYTFTLLESLTSINGLPLRERLVICLSTKKQKIPEEEDPYQPSLNTDTVILNNDDLNSPWFMTRDDSVISNSDGVVVLAAAASDDSSVFYPKSSDKYSVRESKSGTYSEKTNIVFNFSIKLRDKYKVGSASVHLDFECTSASNALEEWENIGSWAPGCVIEYNNGCGLKMYKSVASSKSVQIYNESEIPENEWLNIRGFADMETGTITIIRGDGEKCTLNMNISPGWGSNDKYYEWGKYMYLKQVYIVLKPTDDNTTELELSNVGIKRISNTLSVTSASFKHGEYYVDTNNISLSFNDDITADELKNGIYITDGKGERITCDIDVIDEGNSFNVILNGLEPYTGYTMNIEGLSAVSTRKMPGKFERSFTTKKSGGMFIDTVDKNAVLNTFGKRLSKAEKIQYTVVLKNEGTEVNDVTGAVAVFGENNKLLKIKYGELSLGDNVFDVDEIPLGAVSVRVYGWYKKDGNIGCLLHAPDALQYTDNFEYEFNYSKTLPEFDINVADSSNSVIAVSGKTNDADGLYTVVVLEGKNTPICDVDTKTKAITYAKVDQGKYGNSFAMDAESGDYTVYVITDNSVYAQNFEYLRLNDLVDNYIKKLADGSIAKSQIYNKTKEYNAGIGIDFSEDFVSQRDKDLFEKRMYERRTLLTGPGDSEYTSQLNENISFAKNEIKYINELSAIAYYGLIKDKLDEGLIYTKVDFSEYEKLNDAQKANAMSTMLSKTFADGDDVKKVFDAAVVSASKISSSAAQYSGGGGGSVYTQTAEIEFAYSNPEPPAPVTAEQVFTDLKGYDWAEESILYLAKRGIINGVSESQFNPSGFVTREQFAKMIVIAADLDKTKNTVQFDDVDENEWYAEYIASAQNAGIINGISDEAFGIGMNIKREDMAVMIYRCFASKNVVFTDEKTDFTDMNSISDYAYEAVSALAGAGIINGMDDNSFSPDKYATRAEAAILIRSLVEALS